MKKKISRKITKKNLVSKKTESKIFLGKEILMNLPSSYLENFNEIEKIAENIPFPRSPKKYLHALGLTEVQ